MVRLKERELSRERVIDGIEGHATGQESACAQQVVARWRSEEDNLYLCCSICSTKVAACKFQSRSQSIKTHEASQLHQRAALKWQEIQDKRGVLQGYQDAAAQLTAQRGVVPDKQQASRRAQ